jgi:hypothetical protein
VRIGDGGWLCVGFRFETELKARENSLGCASKKFRFPFVKKIITY